MNRSTLTILSVRFAQLLLVVIACGAAGCHPDDNSPAQRSHGEELRIVSLSPAISRTLIDLGLGEHIVGRTPYCPLDQAIPIAGDLFDMNFEMLVRLRPTHVLVQPPGSGLNPELPAQADKRGWSLHTWQLEGIDDIHRLVRELPEVLARENDPVDQSLVERASALRHAIDAALIVDEHTPIYTGEIMLVVGLDPVTVFGAETYLDDLLRSFGALNMITDRGYPMLSLEDVLRLDPPAILLVHAGPAGDNEVDLRSALGPLARLDVRAWRDERIAMLAHPDALMPSSAITGVAEQLRAILQQWSDRNGAREP